MARSSPLWRHYGGRVIKRAGEGGRTEGEERALYNISCVTGVCEVGACMHYCLLPRSLEKGTSRATKFLIGRDRFVSRLFFLFFFIFYKSEFERTTNVSAIVGFDPVE